MSRKVGKSIQQTLTPYLHAPIVIGTNQTANQLDNQQTLKPLFSILITNYNSAKFIRTCVDSIIQQSFKDYEVVIVDDGSTDDSVQIIESYLSIHKHIHLYRNDKNYGLPYTKTRCIQEAKANILGFVDPDDKIAPNALQEMYRMHLAHPEASLVYSNLFYCDTDLNVTGIKKIGQVPLNQNDFFNQDGYISHFATFKKSAYQKTKGIDLKSRRAEDQDLFCKLYDVGDAILLDQPLYYYRIHSEGLSSLGNEDKSFFDRWRVIFLRAEEKGIDIEDYFLQTFVRRERVKHWIKLDRWFRNSMLYKIYKRLS